MIGLTQIDYIAFVSAIARSRIVCRVAVAGVGMTQSIIWTPLDGSWPQPPGRVRKFSKSHGWDWVGSGRVRRFSNSHGSGRVTLTGPDPS